MVESLIQFLTHPIVMGILAIAGLLLMLFFLRQLFKAALMLILALLLGFALYYGIKTPGDYKEKMKGAVEKTTSQSEALLKKSKDKIVEESKKFTKGLSKEKGEKKAITDRGNGGEGE